MRRFMSNFNYLFCCFYVHVGTFGGLAGITLQLSNDGPAILDSNITFYATLKGDIPEDDYQYTFEDNTSASVRTHTVIGGTSVNLTLHVGEDIYKEDFYTMKVTVWKMIFHVIPRQVASGKMTFRLTEGINGNLLVNGELNPEFIAVGQLLNYTFVLHDPSQFFSNATFQYIWQFNQTAFLNLNRTAMFSATSIGQMLVSLSVFAKIERENVSMVVKTGTINQTYKAVVPINNLTVQGSVFLNRGEVMMLDVRCNGTPPFRYCSKVILDNDTDPCSGQEPVTSTECSFRVMHYFSHLGSYWVGLMVKNNLNMMNRTVNIQIYDVDKRPQLSTIIFPVTSCCIGIVIIVIGVAYHLQQRQTYVIEVADFDFQEPVMLIEKSFVTRVKDSIKDAIESYQQGRNPPEKMIVNGSSRTTPIPSHYMSVS